MCASQSCTYLLTSMRKNDKVFLTLVKQLGGEIIEQYCEILGVFGFLVALYF